MERDQWERQRRLLGKEAMERLAGASVAVFGLGGVGSYAAEALVRSGVGRILFIDGDRLSLSNLNRQLLALHSTLGRLKAEAALERALDISPTLRGEAYPLFVTPENLDEIPLSGCDHVVDAIDTVSTKIALAVRCRELGVPLISSMGTGNKLDPARLELADLAETTVCPLARVMRRELRKRGILHLEVVYSREEPLSPAPEGGEAVPGRRALPGSTAFVPAAAGLMLAGRVVRRLAGLE